MKSVQIRSFVWSVFSRIWTEYGKIPTRKNSVFGHFSRRGKAITAQKMKYSIKDFFSKCDGCIEIRSCSLLAICYSISCNMNKIIHSTVKSWSHIIKWFKKVSRVAGKKYSNCLAFKLELLCFRCGFKNVATI